MKCVVINEPQSCEIVERERPILGGGEALLKVRAVGLCGSDLASYRGANPLVQYPIVVGHEFCGEVEAVADGVSHVAPGDWVTVNPVINCGVCPTCLDGFVNCCESSRTLGVHMDGAAAEWIVAPANKVFKAPKGLSAEEVALIEPVAVGYHAVKNRAGVNADDRVVVLGAGAIGLGAIQTARLFGAPVAVVDIKDSALERAGRLGADCLIRGDKNPVEAVREWTEGRMASVIIEAAGSPRTVALSVDLAAHRARIAMIGYTSQAMVFETPKLFNMKELTFMGSRNSLNVFPHLIEHVRRGQINLSAMISHRFPLDEAPRAFQLWDESPESVCKIILNMR